MTEMPKWLRRIPAFRDGDQEQQILVIANNLSIIWAIIVVLLMYQVFHW